ncbi:MAG: methyltransferase domain-containing protein [Acidobacteria bacterium]|nr:MAG: methyltransferase domain-containing protein [Acidobacteriota bacterium]
MTTIRRLYWGCGDTRPTGWINADITTDIVVDGLALESNSIDHISSQHALQRLEVYYLLTALEELYRVLKPGGTLRLGLSDFDRSVSAWETGRTDYFWCSEWETPSGNLITQLTGYGSTRTPINFEFAEELLRKSGFERVQRVEYRQTSCPYPEIGELDSRPGESFYVEAVKPCLPEPTVVRPGPATQIHLSWNQEPSTSMTIVWHTPLGHSPAFVEYRELGIDTWRRQLATSTPSPGAGKLHQAQLTGLLPATEYEYRASADGEEPRSEIFRTRTAPGPERADFSFAFLCDTGITGRPDGNATGLTQIVNEILAARPLFILGGGDYAYANSDHRFQTIHGAIDAWFVQMQPLLARVPFMAQYGNHEIYLRERFRDWAPRFAFPHGFDHGKNYSFEIGDVHFTALFVPGPPPSAQQMLWLDDDLSEARRRGKRWLIVYQHEPIYAHGHSHPARTEVRRLLAPVLEKHRVDLHLSGHDQNYERTFPLANVSDRPVPVSGSENEYIAGQGVIYAKVSPGGKMSEKRNDFSRFTTEQQPFIAKRDDTAHHWAEVSVDSRGLAVKVYRVAGDGTPSSLCDSFRIGRGESDWTGTGVVACDPLKSR